RSINPCLCVAVQRSTSDSDLTTSAHADRSRQGVIPFSVAALRSSVSIRVVSPRQIVVIISAKQEERVCSEVLQRWEGQLPGVVFELCLCSFQPFEVPWVQSRCH